MQHPRFAERYEQTSRKSRLQRTLEPLRRELIEQAAGLVIEIGAGNGLNFPFYLSEKVTHLEVTEPDATMLANARKRVSLAQVPLTLTQAPVERLPFAESSFDCAVATLVFCSVQEPERGLLEIQRVLKPGGTLLLLEHVRAKSSILGTLQDILVPLTTRMAGNCHWNRTTGRTVRDVGLRVEQERRLNYWRMPFLLLRATCIKEATHQVEPATIEPDES